MPPSKSWWTTFFEFLYNMVCNRVSEKRNDNKTKNAQGVLLIAGVSRIWKVVKSNLLRVYDVDLLRLFYDFSLKVSSFVRCLSSAKRIVFMVTCNESTAVCFATFRRDLLLPSPQSLSHNLRRHRSPSRRPARGCVSYFLCPAWWASIYRSTCLSIFCLAC